MWRNQIEKIARQVMVQSLARPYSGTVVVEKKRVQEVLDEIWETTGIKRMPRVKGFREGKFPRGRAEHLDLWGLYKTFWEELLVESMAMQLRRPIMVLANGTVTQDEEHYTLQTLLYPLPVVRFRAAREEWEPVLQDVFRKEPNPMEIMAEKRGRYQQFRWPNPEDEAEQKTWNEQPVAFDDMITIVMRTRLPDGEKVDTTRVTIILDKNSKQEINDAFIGHKPGEEIQTPPALVKNVSEDHLKDLFAGIINRRPPKLTDWADLIRANECRDINELEVKIQADLIKDMAETREQRMLHVLQTIVECESLSTEWLMARINVRQKDEKIIGKPEDYFKGEVVCWYLGQQIGLEYKPEESKANGKSDIDPNVVSIKKHANEENYQQRLVKELRWYSKGVRKFFEDQHAGLIDRLKAAEDGSIRAGDTGAGQPATITPLVGVSVTEEPVGDSSPGTTEPTAAVKG